MVSNFKMIRSITDVFKLFRGVHGGGNSNQEFYTIGVLTEARIQVGFCGLRKILNIFRTP